MSTLNDLAFSEETGRERMLLRCAVAECLSGFLSNETLPTMQPILDNALHNLGKDSAREFADAIRFAVTLRGNLDHLKNSMRLKDTDAIVLCTQMRFLQGY